MKTSNLIQLAGLAVAFALAACGTQKKAVGDDTTKTSTAVLQKQEFLQQVVGHAQQAEFLTSKVKFSLEAGNQKISLSGSLKMRRDDVIRLQLTAFGGLVEAGRLEFTEDYVLLMDRINKQYVKVDYNQLDFLRNNGLNFHALQALFWNELFQPGKTTLTDAMLADFTADFSGTDAVITTAKNRLHCRWHADKTTAQLNSACMEYGGEGTYQLDWGYSNFKPTDGSPFPYTHNITLHTPYKTIMLGLTLNELSYDRDWEARTSVSSKYREVTIDQILRRLTAL